MRSRFLFSIIFSFIGLLIVIGLVAVPIPSLAAADSSPSASLQRAWELARQSGSYNFTTRLVQTTHPAPSINNVGRSPRVETIYIEGETDLASDILLMRIWQDGGRLSDLSTAAEVRVENGKAYGRQGVGAWQEIDNFSDSLAPGNDASAFLVAARNVELASSTLYTPRYTFNLSGPVLADYLRTQLEDQLRATGELPPGMHLDAPEQFRKMIGDGEVWLDSAGLPQRLSIMMEYPQTANGERVEIEMQTDFSNFDQAAIAQANPQSPISNLQSSIFNFQNKASDPEVLLSFSGIGLLLLVLFNSRSKKVYTAIVIVVILSMLFTPLLQNAQVYAFNQNQTARQNESEQQQAEQEAAQEIQDELYGDHWDPHAKPGAVDSDQLSMISELAAVSGLLSSTTRLQAASADNNTNDDDNDGLSGDDDPCPDDPDCDDDGLTDGQEERLGTDPEEKDTDGDYITDNAEVAGFWFNNQWWFSDPSNPDTNNDGINDGAECSEKVVDEDDLSPEDNACEDSDGDDTPDIFDHDNDDDRVPDRVDISPFSATYQENGNPFDGENPLQIQVDALQSDLPVFLDIQLRTENENHLWYALNVLDWPSNDEHGQIMRKRGNDSTFEDLDDPADNASNGDIRLIPMLEIEIPYKDGHYANLPVLEGAPARTQDTDLDDWLDREALSDYGISVRPKNDDGDLVAYVPLNLVEDGTGGDRVAFGGRMFYWPTNEGDNGSTDWGNTQQMRVVWLVEMLADYKCTAEQEDDGDCTEGEWVTDSSQIVIGYDEDWYLTGLSVREDHGLEIAIAYEDPSEESSDEDRQYDDYLWALAYGLDQTFLTGRDEDEDGERDISIDEIHARFDNRVNSGTSDEERWEIPIEATQVITYAYDHEDYFVHVMVTETQNILTKTFDAYRDQGSDASTLLFAQEAQYRDINLENNEHVTQDGNLLRIDLDPEAIQQSARTFLSWAPYRYNEDDECWENYPIEEYMDKMEVRLKDSFDEYEDEPDYEDILRGQIMLAQSYYLSYYAGAMRVVQIGDTITGNYGSAQSDGEMAEWISGVDFDKAGGMMARQTYGLANTLAKITKYWNNSAQLFKDLGIRSQGSFKATIQHVWRNTSWKKLKLGVAIAGAVIALGALIAAAALLGTGHNKAALIALDSVMVSIGVLDALFTANSIRKFIKASESVGKWTKLKDVMKTKGMKYSYKAFSIGVVVVGVLMVAAFLIAWGVSGERWDSLAFTLGLAHTLASIITMVILMAIAAIPIVGQIVATVIFLLDTIFQLICHTQDRDAEDFFCKGISGYVSDFIRWTIFNQNIMINLDDKKRLKVTDFESELQDIEPGMSQGNSLVVTVDTKQHIRALTYSEIKANWMAVLYKWQYSDKTTKSSTFKDHLEASQRDHHSNLNRESMSNDWTSKKDDYFDFESSDSSNVPLDTVGINQTPNLYLNDAYAVPVQECWLIPNPFVVIGLGPPAIPVCYVRTERGTSHIDLGKNMYYDIFPATFDEFIELTQKDGGYALAWSQDSSPAFPRLKDADGDGLRNKNDGGADPDDHDWDSDGDRLSDGAENRLGSDPLDYDSDDDGLDDYTESLLDTDLNRADSDYDGLTDQEEVDGWEFVYDFAEDGSQLATWVTSDPLSIDGDGDNFSDFQEKTYGFHPRVKSDPNILTLETQVNEVFAPRLLLRLDETLGATAFGDDSGYVNNAACLGTHCPVAGHYGKYGNAPHFDGSDDYLEVSDHESLKPNTELTLSTWVYLSNPNADQKIIGKTTTNDGYLMGVDNGQLFPEIWDSQGAHYAAHWGSIPTETWTHLGLTWRSGGQMIGYINGTEVGRTPASARPIGENTNPLRIGIAPWNASAWPVEGRIDEVLVFPRALSESEIQVQAAGRYNPEDLSVHSGDELYYEATVTNELFNRYAQGLLSTHFPAAFSELPPQDFVLNPQENETLSGIVTVGGASSGVYTLVQEADALITDWREDSNYAEALYRFSNADTFLEDSSGAQPPRDGECEAGQCPALATGRYGNGAEFDGSNDYASADAVADALADAKALSFGGWVYPESGMSANGVMLSFHTGNGNNLLMLEYDPVGDNAEKFIAYDANSGDNYSTNTFAPDQWYHVMLVIHEGSNTNAYLYINGVKEAQFNSEARPETDGRFSLGQEWDGSTASNFFRGRLDEIVVYPRALTQQEVLEHFNNPIFHLPFDEGIGAQSFEDDSGFENDAICSGFSCPQSGREGISLNAVQFDGQDHLTVPDDAALGLSEGEFTLSTWVYPDGDTPISDCPFRAEYFDNNGGYNYLHHDRDTVRRCEDYPINHEWADGEVPISGWYAEDQNNFSIRWTGTFFFEEADHTFTFTTDDGMRAWLDDDQLLNEWHNQSATTYNIDRTVNAGWHTIKVEYYEAYKEAVAKVSWSPGPLPQPQGILGTEDYPTILRIGNRLGLALNPSTLFITEDEVLTPAAWNHAAASFDTNTWFLYVDGVEVDQFNIDGQTPADGQGFEIGRVDSTAQLDLENIYTFDIDNDGYGNTSMRINLQLDNGDWQTIWEQSDVYSEEEFPIDTHYTFEDTASIQVEDGTFYNYDDMGTETIQAQQISPHEYCTRFENYDSEADLTWYSRIDSVPFVGKIDETAIYKVALSPDEVHDLYDAGTMVLRLPLDDAPGASDFIDATDQHNGSCSGDACPTAGVPGREEMALLFDGTNDYVTINDSNTADLQNLTIAAWVNLSNTPAGIMRFVTVGNEKAVLGYDVDGGGDLHFYLKTTDGSYHHLRHEISLQTGIWYHLSGTYDGNTMRFYINGAEVERQSLSGDLVGGDMVMLSHSNETLDGYLDEILIYRRALSASEIQALYNAAPEMLLLLDEEGQSTTFSDASGNGHSAACSGDACPDAGAKGQIGLAAIFDGENDYLEVNSATSLNPGTEMTLIAWVKLEDTDPDQKIAGKSTSNDGYVLGIQDSQLYPEIWDSSGTRYSDQWGRITAGYWTQVAFTWESGGNLVGYINGQEAGRISASANPIGSNNSPLRVGIAPWNSSSFPANGRIDQVTLYTRALSASEMRDTFRLQAKWVEDRQNFEIKVDNDNPVSTLISDDTHRPNQSVVLLVGTSDATTAVTLVEMGVQTPGAGGYNWLSVPPCEDSRDGTAWCPTFEPTEGEGRYLLQFRATDIVGNRETPAQTYTILVDDTPPQAGTGITEGQIVRAELQPDHSWLLPLSGTVADPQVDGSPGSGVADVTVKLTDTDPVTDTLPLLTAAHDGSNWQADYPLLEADATDTYELSVKSTDQMGNSTELITLITLAVDTSPPEASLNDITAQTGVTGTITTTLQISGQITETGEIMAGINDLRLNIIPAAMESLSGTVGIYLFDEPAGAESFSNQAGSGQASCQGSTCPTGGETGIWGAAPNFDNADDYLSADHIAAAISDTNGLAFGAWVYPTSSMGAVLAFDAADNTDRNQIRYSGAFYYTDVDGPHYGPSGIGHDEGQWHYVMVSIAEDGQGTLYVNGQPFINFETDMRPDPNGYFSIGMQRDGSGNSDFFGGLIDEVRVYDRVLSASEIVQVYADAALDDAGAGITETNWNYSIPAGLDGLYQINQRPDDIHENSAPNDQWPVWNGLIDTRGPQVELTIVENEETYDVAGQNVFSVETTYTCWAQDFNLMVASEAHPEYEFECPCQGLAPASTTISSTFYHEVSPWYADVFTDTLRLWEYQETCTVLGGASEFYMKACDTNGRCSTPDPEYQSPYNIIPDAYTVVLTPTHQTVLTVTDSITIAGRAFARQRIQQVEIYDGLSHIGTDDIDLSCSDNITNTLWTLPSWIPTEGIHNLNSRVFHCGGGNANGESNQVYMDTTAPFVSLYPTEINRDQRLSYGRVALKGTVTDDFGLVQGSGVARVEVSVDGSDWAEASFDEDGWQWDWYLGEEPDGATYNIDVRATDRAGWLNEISEIVTVDLDVPNPITLALEGNSQVITPGITIRIAPTTLDLSWEASEPSEKLSHYEVLWTVDTPTQTLQIPAVVSPTWPLVSQYIAGEAQRIEPQVSSIFNDGNKQVDDWGPVYVDTPLTPDYMQFTVEGGSPPYLGWMDSGCSVLGVDRRVQENAPDGVALDDPQNLYVTWDNEGLRLAWVGANWDYSGDLFIYLDDLTDPDVALTAYNPFTDTQDIDIHIPGAKAFIWVKNTEYAELNTWNGSGWDWASLKDYYRFEAGMNGGTTHLYIPFDMLGISNPETTPLTLFAFATDEGAMRLWGTMPPQNPVNSPRVVETDLYAGAQQALEWMHIYSWPSLSSGICPNYSLSGASPFSDSDLRFGLSASPDGSTYGLSSSDLFWLADELTHLTRTADLSQQFTFMDVDHPLVGDGDTIEYTLSYANHGEHTASGVTVQAVALFDLQFQGSTTQTISIGDVAPGGSGNVTFSGQVDSSASSQDWAVMSAAIYDADHGLAGNALDWLWADHQVDSQPPVFLGILSPDYIIGAGSNSFSGYAFDPSGVPALTIEADPPSGGNLTGCQDDTPDDGFWSCLWDAGSASDGDIYQIRLQAEDRYGQASDWTPWRDYIVDTVPPTLTLSAATQALSNTVLSHSAVSFSGSAGDNRGLGGTEFCLNGECREGNLQISGTPGAVYDADPGAPQAIGACGSGEVVSTFDVADSFTVSGVALGLNIEHPKRDELQVILSNGTTSVMVINPPSGTPSEFANFDVYLEDAATAELHTKTNDNPAQPYYERLARPDVPLADFYGNNAAATWTLTICDTNTGSDDGSFNRAQLTLKQQNNATTTGEWFFTATGLEDQDYASQTLEAYALDLAGNRSDAATLTLWVDNVAPVLTVSEITEIAGIGPGSTTVRTLAGVVTDGGAINQLYAMVLTPGGDRQSMQIGRNGDQWWLDLAADEPGVYTLWVNAVDLGGNAVTVGPYELTIVRVLAVNNSPTALGTTTTFTATVLGDDDSAYSFDWDFGDGVVASDQLSVINYQYATADVYTATVMTHKGNDVFKATTVVIVDEAISGLTAINDGPAFPGATTQLTATISTGSNVAYTWDFGDGLPSAMGNQAATLHNYAAGAYTATVTALNSVSLVTATTQVQIVDLMVISDSPTEVRDTTTFTATLVGDTTTAYAWDFGDQSPAVLDPSPVISHSYQLPDIYTATVEVETVAGVISATTTVNVTGLDVINDSPTALGSATAFTAATSLTGTVIYEWDFGDPSAVVSGPSAVISHTYPAAKVYTAVITVTNGSEILTTTSQVFIDNQAPAVGISDPVEEQVIRGATYTIQGTAVDDIGLAMVEVSTDGGQTWQPATGLESWTYEWIVPVENQVSHTLLARATDQVGHLTISEPVEVIVNTKQPYRLYFPIIMQ